MGYCGLWCFFMLTASAACAAQGSLFEAWAAASVSFPLTCFSGGISFHCWSKLQYFGVLMSVSSGYIFTFLFVCAVLWIHFHDCLRSRRFLQIQGLARRRNCSGRTSPERPKERNRRHSCLLTC